MLQHSATPSPSGLYAMGIPHRLHRRGMYDVYLKTVLRICALISPSHARRCSCSDNVTNRHLPCTVLAQFVREATSSVYLEPVHRYGSNGLNGRSRDLVPCQEAPWSFRVRHLERWAFTAKMPPVRSPPSSVYKAADSFT